VIYFKKRITEVIKMKTFPDISYGTHPMHLLNIYLPETEEFDVFVYFHGGGIEAGSRSFNEFNAEQITGRNVAVVSVEYRMYPDTKFPEYVEDCALAVAWVKNNMEKYGKVVAQILLTKDTVDNPIRRHNAESTFKLLLEHGCIPIVNENDCVSSEEIQFGGNDTLSAYVACLADADLLINLSDVDGLYDSDPRKNPNAKHIDVVTDVESVLSMASGAGTDRGTGGMQVKLAAAKIVGEAGIPMIIANGENPSVLYDILESDEHKIGTLFMPSKNKN
jgi:isopentenyl phosphate kinase